MAIRSFITNLRNVTFSLDIALEGHDTLRVLLPPLGTVEVTGRATKDQLEDNPQLLALVAAGKITLAFDSTTSAGSLIAAPKLLAVKWDVSADVTGGGTTRAVGFQVIDDQGAPFLGAVLVEVAAFSDAGMTQPSLNATLNTATAGVISAGGGTAALKVVTSTEGRFSCTLTDLMDETIYLSCSSTFGGPVLDCREFDTVAFS